MGGLVGEVSGALGFDDVTGALTGETAADASREAAGLSADAQIRAAQIAAKSQRQALQYLKKKERLPMRVRDLALKDLRQFYISPQGQQQFIDETMASPFYQQQVQAGEEAIGRNLAMTGGLRSGTANQALAQNNQQVLQNLVNQRLAGIQGLAGTPTQAANIAQLQAGIGQTLGQGISGAGQAQAQGLIGGAQAQQAAIQGLLSAGGQIGGAVLSDPRLKENRFKVGEYKGISLFVWDWNKEAEKMGQKGKGFGVMADQIKELYPEFVTEKDGYMAVNYQGLFGALNG